MAKKIIFGVYGTLKKGQINHEILEHPNVEFLGQDMTTGDYTLINMGNFPAAVNFGVCSIDLEVYCTDDEWILSRIHELEGYKGKDHPDNLYHFEAVRTFQYSPVHIWLIHPDSKLVKQRVNIIKEGSWRGKPNAKLKMDAQPIPNIRWENKIQLADLGEKAIIDPIGVAINEFIEYRPGKRVVRREGGIVKNN